MKISLEWLKEYCKWTWSTDELVDKLTISGTEVEHVDSQGVETDLVVTAKVLKKAQHPNADRLSLCQVTDGTETRQIVCGATNFKEGDIVPLAKAGAVLGKDFVIKEAKMRGELSQGMMCSESELGFSADAKGLMLLPQDTPLGVPLKQLYPAKTVLEIEVTPNRADLLSYRGIAKELIALGAKPTDFTLPTIQTESSASKYSIDNQAPTDCPRYTAQELTDVKVAPSPDWMQNRLKAIGLRPINNVVDITNYVLFVTGQPLHAFDADLLKGNKIIVRHATKGEKIKALDDKEYELQDGDTVIADAEKATAIAGVMGGEATGVTDKTTRIILESAQFKPTKIRSTSRRLGIISDSSYRFEREIDSAGVDIGRHYAIKLLQELAGAKLSGATIESAPYTYSAPVIKLRPERLKMFMGYEVSSSRADEILSALGLKKASDWAYEIPSNRPDLVREIDLIEEISRIEGLDKVPSRFELKFNATTPVDLLFAQTNKVRETLAGMGFIEIMTNSIRPRTTDEKAIQLVNPLNEDYATMRQTLLETALPVVHHNISREQKDLRLFEIGTVYSKENNRIKEEQHLVILMAGLERPAHWTEKERAADFFTLKGVADALQVRFPELKTTDISGSVSKKNLSAYGIKVPVYAVELILPKKAQTKAKKFAELPKYPAVNRDLALVVDRAVTHEQILASIQKSGVKELENIDCFDFFKDDSGQKLPADKKSLAYTLTFRSPESTLKDVQVNQFQQAILAELKKTVGAELRQ